MLLKRAVGKNEKLKIFKTESPKLESFCLSWNVSLELESSGCSWRVKMNLESPGRWTLLSGLKTLILKLDNQSQPFYHTVWSIRVFQE